MIVTIATRSLCRGLRWGSCFLLACGLVSGEDKIAHPIVPSAIKEVDVNAAKVAETAQLHLDAEMAMRKLHESLNAALAASNAVVAARAECKTQYQAAVDSVLNGEEPAVQAAKQREYSEATHRVEVLRGVYAKRINLLKHARDEARVAHQRAIRASDRALQTITETILQEAPGSTVQPAEDMPSPDNAGGRREILPQSTPSRSASELAQSLACEIPFSEARRMTNNPTDSDFTYVDAFWKLPLVANVPTAADLDFTTHPVSTANNANATAGFLCDYRFDRPAEFPLMTYGLRGERHDDRGAVIYEGMRLAIRNDGRYQVRFVMGTPPLPIEMELQFVLQDDQCREYSLTLPPIRVPGRQPLVRNAEGNRVDPVQANTETIHHEGYLPVLAEAGNNIRIVRRTGSARFGFGVEVP